MRGLPPLPLLDHFGVGLFDQGAKPGEGLAPPVAQFFDPCVYQLSWRLDLLRGALLHVVDVPLLCWWVIGPSMRMATAADGNGSLLMATRSWMPSTSSPGRCRPFQSDGFGVIDFPDICPCCIIRNLLVRFGKVASP